MCPISLPCSFLQVDVRNASDLCRDRGGGGCEVLLPAGLQSTGSLTPANKVGNLFNHEKFRNMCHAYDILGNMLNSRTFLSVTAVSIAQQQIYTL